jgi:hypothetical protein
VVVPDELALYLRLFCFKVIYVGNDSVMKVVVDLRKLILEVDFFW